MKKTLKKISLKKTTVIFLGENASKMKNGGNADGQSVDTYTYGGLTLCYCPRTNSKVYTACNCL
jgi:hypothetical protein